MGIMYYRTKQCKDKCTMSSPSPVDVPFILHTIHILLAKSDHTVNLLRALSFVYSHFAFLTSRAVLLDMLCSRILLEPYIFEKLLLHWSRNVRHFFWRCLFWRVGRVWSHREIKWPQHPDTQRGKETCDGLSCFQSWCEDKTGTYLMSIIATYIVSLTCYYNNRTNTLLRSVGRVYPRTRKQGV